MKTHTNIDLDQSFVLHYLMKLVSNLEGAYNEGPQGSEECFHQAHSITVGHLSEIPSSASGIELIYEVSLPSKRKLYALVHAGPLRKFRQTYSELANRHGIKKD